MGLAVVVLGLAAYHLYDEESPESKERIKIAIEQTKVAKKVRSFAEDFLDLLRDKHCVMTPEGEVYAYAGPDIDRLICLISADGKNVKSLVFPKAEKRLH
jgi:hypothetical protein